MSDSSYHLYICFVYVMYNNVKKEGNKVGEISTQIYSKIPYISSNLSTNNLLSIQSFNPAGVPVSILNVFIHS